MENTVNKIQLPSSFVNEYQLALLEAADGRNSQDELTNKRMQICFRTFDELIPKLGIFQKVIKAIRNDLFDGVYSDQYTTYQEAGSLDSVVQVPFFKLVKKLNEQRDEKADELYAQIHELDMRNEDLRKILDQKEAEISMLKEANNELKGQIKDLGFSLNSERERISELQSSLKMRERECANMETGYREEVNQLKKELQACEEDSNVLSEYKQSYEELKDAFENPHLPHQTFESTNVNEDSERKEFTNPRIEQIQRDLLVMEKLENQLQFVRNCAIDEYEDVLENGKTRFEESRNYTSSVKELKGTTINSELQSESQKLVKTQKMFSDAILDIKAELALLLQHRNMLLAELARLEQDDANKKEARRSKKSKNNNDLTDIQSLEELDLVEIMVGNTDDPFVPHENILNKYSSMIYTSCNEGKTFYEIPDARFCESCGVKTLICPHLVANRERILSLPKHCTHIKVVRPKVKIPRSRRRKKSDSNKFPTENKLLPRLKFVWEDLAARTDTERKHRRLLSEDHLLSIIHQFYALVVWQDEYESIEEETYSLLETFYIFLQDRYLLEDAVNLIFHDILCSVEICATKNKYVHLFAACLDGTVDAATFRYLLLMNEFISSFLWTQMQDFTAFLSIVYPFLTEDDLEHLRMGYTSFSENKVSPFIIFRYLLYLVLNGKEPKFLEFESKLLQCPVRKPGYFTDIEFVEALDSFVPLAPERLLQRLFSQSVKHFPDSVDAVNIKRISHITSYLSLIQESPRIINSIKQWKVQKNSALSETRQSSGQHTVTTQSSNRHEIMILSKVKLLGAEMGRRNKARKHYQEQQRLALEFESMSPEETSAEES